MQPKTDRAVRIVDVLFWILLCTSLLCAGFYLSVGWSYSILDHHAFRQGQTAISALFMLRGGRLVAYETPVLGYPWAIPFEFPLYQWIVALLAKAGVVQLDQAGRTVSVAFWGGSVVLFWRILGALGLEAKERIPAMVLTLLSPVYLFWSRTFMIESTALFFGLCFLDRAITIARSPQRRIAWAQATFAAVAGALVKVTTFLGFAVAGALVAATGALHFLRRGERRGAMATVVGIGLSLGLAFVALKVWVQYADALKAANPFARNFITSEALKFWNFSDWNQRMNPATWNVFWAERGHLYLGSRWVVVAFALLPFVIQARLALLALSAFAVYLSYFLVFTNLHVVHDYYQYSNTLFLTASLGFLIAGLMRQGSWARIGSLLATLIIGTIMLGSYRSSYLLIQAADHRDHDKLGAFIRSVTGPDEVIAIFGWDWSAELPYVAQRRALMERNNRRMSEPDMQEALRLLERQGQRVSLMIACGKERKSERNAERLEALLPDASLIFSDDPSCDVYGDGRRLAMKGATVP